MESTGHIYVVTGERGSGKSTVCARVAGKAADKGLAVAGILTRRTDHNDLSSPRTVIDLRSGDSRIFGRRLERDREEGRSQPAGPTDNQAAAGDALAPGWEFDPEVFAWGNLLLERAVPCDLLVIDEIGPLELLGRRGWTASLRVLRHSNYGAALVTCRPGLLSELTRQLRPPNSLFEVHIEERDHLPAAILATLPTRSAFKSL